MSDIEGGPGWAIRSADLRPIVIDLSAFRAGLSEDPLGEALELLWTGSAEAALRHLEPFAPTARVRVLKADCHRDLGDTAGAVREYDMLVEESTGTVWEAVMRQHRGKALLAAGQLEGAVRDFERAVELRRGGDTTLLASAEQALAVAQSRTADSSSGRP